MKWVKQSGQTVFILIRTTPPSQERGKGSVNVLLLFPGALGNLETRRDQEGDQQEGKALVALG